MATLYILKYSMKMALIPHNSILTIYVILYKLDVSKLEQLVFYYVCTLLSFQPLHRVLSNLLDLNELDDPSLRIFYNLTECPTKTVHNYN